MIDYQPLPENHQKRIVAIIAVKNKSGAARIFGCTRQSIKAAAGGLPVHPYLALRLVQKLAERDAAGKVP